MYPIYIAKQATITNIIFIFIYTYIGRYIYLYTYIMTASYYILTIINILYNIYIAPII